MGSLALPNPQLFPSILNTENSNFQPGRKGLRERKPFPSPRRYTRISLTC